MPSRPKHHLATLVAVTLWWTTAPSPAQTVAKAEASGAAKDAVAAQVRQRLAALDGQHWAKAPYDGTVAFLRALGPDALPALVAEIPGAGPIALAAASEVVGEARFHPAAAALLERMGSVPRIVWEKAFHHSIAASVYHAFEVTASPEQAAVLARRFDAGELSETELAYRTLAVFGTPETAAAAERFRLRGPRQRAWYSPPNGSRYLAVAGLSEPEVRSRLEGRESAIEEAIRAAAESARLALPDGSALVVFPDSRLGGNNDLWAIPIDAAGRTGVALFLGSIVPYDPYEELPPRELEAWLDGRTVAARWRSRPAAILRTDLDAASRDRDGDGLPDLVEQRLGLDADNPDSDGDGVPDGQDLTPNGGGSGAVSEADAIAEEILWYFIAFTKHPPDDAIGFFFGGSTLRHPGCSCLILVVNEERRKQLREEIGTGRLLGWSIEAGWQSTRPVATEPRAEESSPMAANERRYTLFHDGAAYVVTVRKGPRRWVVTNLWMAWIS